MTLTTSPGQAFVDTMSDNLKHYGVKGMKWGVRKDHTAQDIEFRARAGKKVKTSGGKRHEPTQDAINAAVLRQKAKKSTTDSLTNKELREAIDRMNLEQQYSRLSGENKSVGKKFLDFFLGDMGDQQYSDLGDFVADKSGKPAAGVAASMAAKAAVKTATGGKKK